MVSGTYYYLNVLSYFTPNCSHQSLGRLKDLVAEHLDHLHYLNDILCLQIEPLNVVLTEHLLNRLFIPLYIFSLGKHHRRPPGRASTASTSSATAAASAPATPTMSGGNKDETEEASRSQNLEVNITLVCPGTK